MSLVVNLYYTGKNGSARLFAEEMTSSGTVDKIRSEEGNLRYEYFASISDPETILLIDEWESQEALDKHHKSEIMKTISELREKYKLRLRVERFNRENG